MTARHRRQGRSSSAQVYRDRTISEGWQKLRFCVYRLGCFVTLLGVISPPPLPLLKSLYPELGTVLRKLPDPGQVSPPPTLLHIRLSRKNKDRATDYQREI